MQIISTITNDQDTTVLKLTQSEQNAIVTTQKIARAIRNNSGNGEQVQVAKEVILAISKMPCKPIVSLDKPTGKEPEKAKDKQTEKPKTPQGR